MTAGVNLRKSTRITKNNKLSLETTGNNSTSAQSRITEFVNVRKRATSASTDVDLVKKSAGSLDVDDTKGYESETVGTPVKIKRKQVKSVVDVKPIGVLTPSPSLELEPLRKTNETAGEESKDGIIIPVEIKTEAKAPAYKRFAHLVGGVRNQKVKLEAVPDTPSKTDVPCVPDTPCTLDIPCISDTTCTPESTPFKFVPWLPLNEKWTFYEKLIFNVDSLCVLAAGRSQPCIFHKIQKTLENVLGKQVLLDHMERLKTLWPEVYECRESRVIIQGKRVESVALSVPGIAGTDSSSALLNDRKDQVRSRVQKYLIEAHAREFEYPATEIPKQWNDKFDQDKVAELFRTPLITKNVEKTVSDTPKMIEEIISNTMSPKKTSTETLIGSSVTSSTSTTSTSNTQKMSLLERIRAKEQALQAKKCFTSPDEPSERINAIISQMDRFTQSVMFTFTSAKKTSLFLSDLTNKLAQSSTIPLSSTEILERLKILEKCSPDWIKICDSEDCGPKYVKILDRTRSLNSVLEQVHLKYK